MLSELIWNHVRFASEYAAGLKGRGVELILCCPDNSFIMARKLRLDDVDRHRKGIEAHWSEVLRG